MVVSRFNRNSNLKKLTNDNLTSVGGYMSTSTNLQTLYSAENNAVLLALQNGHLDPRNNISHNSCLIADGANRRILEYKKVEVTDINNDQNVRHVDINELYCLQELSPLMRRKYEDCNKSLGLEYPIMVIEKGEKYEIVHGHNRFHSLVHHLKLNYVPVFVIENVGTSMQKLCAKIAPNAKKADDSRAYTMGCVVKQLKDIRETGEYFTNIADEDKTREEFVILMNKIHPHQFIAETTRGKIFKNFYVNRSTKSTMVVPTKTDSYIDSFLARNNYSTRYHLNSSGKKTRTHLPYFTCSKNKAIVLYGIDNKHLFERSLWLFLKEWSNNEDYRKAYKDYSIHLIPTLVKVPGTLPELNARRDDTISQFEEHAGVLKNLPGIPEITKITFPMQLTIEKNDVVYTLDEDGDFIR